MVRITFWILISFSVLKILIESFAKSQTLMDRSVFNKTWALQFTKYQARIFILTAVAVGDSAVISRQADRLIIRYRPWLSDLTIARPTFPSANTCSCRVLGRIPNICLTAQAVTSSLQVQLPKQHGKNVWRLPLNLYIPASFSYPSFH